MESAGSNQTYIDHVETILLSPEKESINPKTAFKEELTKENNVNGTATDISSVDEKSEKQKDLSRSDPNIDSGLDSSNNSSDAPNERFVDRQESLVEMVEPDAIVSPNKMVDHLFNFIDSEAQSLDAVNNNSEVTVQCGQSEDISDLNVEVANGSSLGTEVDMHGRAEKSSVCVTAEDSLNTAENESEAIEFKIASPGATEKELAMNMYWYSSTLDLDPLTLEKELEASNKSVNESFTSTIQMSIEGQKEDETADANESKTNVLKDNVAQSTVEKKETWSSAFESASSRFIDLALEMKSEPKAKKNRENNSIKESVDNDKGQHPWGLEADNRVVSDPVEMTKDELPSIVSIPPTTNTVTSASEYCVDVVDGRHGSVDGEDVADAIGYMELKDRDEIIKKQSTALVSENDTKEKKLDEDKLANKDQVIDEADAVGYMDIKDKPIEDIIQSTESSELKSQFTDAVVEKSVQIESKESVSSIIQKVESQVIDAGDAPDGSNESIHKECLVEISEMKLATELESATVQVKEELMEPIEVERKFRIAEDTEKKIVEMGGILMETQKFTDEYLDNDCYSLTLQDCWLRLRNKKFELKVNAAIQGSSKTTLYNEVTSEKEIKEFLTKKFAKKVKQSKKDENKPLDVVIDELGLMEFATFETTRKTYKMENCVVDLDLTDFGFQVGEIEVVVDNPNKVTTALEIIDSMAVKLGLNEGDDQMGKLETYLQTRSPHHYACLVNADVY